MGLPNVLPSDDVRLGVPLPAAESIYSRRGGFDSSALRREIIVISADSSVEGRAWERLDWGQRFVSWVHMEREGSSLWGMRALVVVIHVLGLATVVGMVLVIAYHRESVRWTERERILVLKGQVEELTRMNLELQRARDGQDAELARLNRCFAELQSVGVTQFC